MFRSQSIQKAFPSPDHSQGYAVHRCALIYSCNPVDTQLLSCYLSQLSHFTMPPPKGSASFKRSDAHHKPHLNVVSGSFSSKKRTERTHSRGQSSSQDNRDDDESSPVTTQRKCLSCSCINFFHSLGDDYGERCQVVVGPAPVGSKC